MLPGHPKACAGGFALLLQTLLLLLPLHLALGLREDQREDAVPGRLQGNAYSADKVFHGVFLQIVRRGAASRGADLE